MSSQNSQSRLQKLHQSVTQRETQYLQILDNHLPKRVSSLLENNFFTSVPLYTFLLAISLVSSILIKASETDLGKEAKKIASEAKKNFLEEKEELNKHFAKVLEDAKAEAQKKVDEAQNVASKASDEMKAALEQAKDDLKESKKELVRAQDEILNRKAEHAKFMESAKKATEDSHVHVSDLHYQIAEKDKKIRALESVQHHLEADLAKEKELHESSKEGLHEAIEKLMEAKKQFANGSPKKTA